MPEDNDKAQETPEAGPTKTVIPAPEVRTLPEIALPEIPSPDLDLCAHSRAAFSKEFDRSTSPHGMSVQPINTPAAVNFFNS